MIIFTHLADLLTFRLLALDPTTKVADAIHFFIEDTSKIFTLLIIMIYLISLLRAGLNADRIRDFLGGKRRIAGYGIASAFGAVTPFCSCSSIPLFLGFTTARIPMGITMAFLITSPMINEVAVLLLLSLFGWKFLLLYVATGFAAGIIGGALMDLIGAERYLMPLGQQAVEIGREDASETCDAGCACSAPQPSKIDLAGRRAFASRELKTILAKVWPWIIGGVAAGAFLHGFIPENFLAQYLHSSKWWSVPAAVLIGIPLYSGASGVIPVAQSLMEAGLPAGTTVAFMMSVVAASFPEFAMLKQVMKTRLLVMFFCLLLVFFTLAGWLFNFAL